ncbi:hypothetical protein ACU4GD_39600 [Cupriavidus basilensis]
MLLPVVGACAGANAPNAPNVPNMPNAARCAQHTPGPGQTMRDLETVRPELPAPSVWSSELPKADDRTRPPRPPSRGHA